MKLFSLIITDLLKQKRSSLGFIVLIIPLGTTAAMFLDMRIRYKDWLVYVAREKGISSWLMLISENHKILDWSTFLPFFVAILGAVIYQTEFSQGSLKTLLSMPIKKSHVMISKFVVILFLSFIMIILNSLGLILVGSITGFPEAIDYRLFINYILFQCIGVTVVAAIHNWLSSYYKNYLVPIAIGFLGKITASNIIYDFPQYSIFNPYTYTFYAAGLNGFKPEAIIYPAIILTGVVITLGILEFRKRDIL